MGTNYYHEAERLCPHCNNETGGGEQTHIGKSSAGWSFSFHGTDDIKSYQDWLNVFALGGKILDEYGKYYSVGDFMTLVNNKDDGKKHYDWVQANHEEYLIDPDDDWLDPEGHCFSSGEFS